MARKYEIRATTYDKRGRKIASALNTYVKTHTYQAELAVRAGLDSKLFLHAEVAAIIKSKNRTIHKIKIERYDVTGKPKLAKPCPVCELAIKEAGISLVEYTVGTDD